MIERKTHCESNFEIISIVWIFKTISIQHQLVANSCVCVNDGNFIINYLWSKCSVVVFFIVLISNYDSWPMGIVTVACFGNTLLLSIHLHTKAVPFTALSLIILLWPCEYQFQHRFHTILKSNYLLEQTLYFTRTGWAQTIWIMLNRTIDVTKWIWDQNRLSAVSASKLSEFDFIWQWNLNFGNKKTISFEI